MPKPKQTPPPPPVHEQTVKCPFVVLVDSNEAQATHRPYAFEGIASNADTGYALFDVKTETRFLAGLGDYQIECPGLGPWQQPIIAVERKSPEDLFSSIVKRENMEYRLNRLSNECEFAAVVVEAEFGQMMANPPAYSNMTFKAVHATIQSWMQRYKGVSWLFYPDRPTAELGTFWLLYRFYENIKEHKANTDREQMNFKAFYEGMLSFKKKEPMTSCTYKRKHRIGDYVDYWIRGWLTQEAVTKIKPYSPSERHLIPRDLVDFHKDFESKE